MRFLPTRTLSSIILVASLAVMLIVLAVLQYRWSGQISEAEHERMHTSLLASMNQFRLHFNNEFQRLEFLFQPDAQVLAHRDWQSYAASCELAFDGVDYHLVRNIYLWISETNGGSQLLRLNRNAGNFEPSSCPPGYGRIRNRYDRFFANRLRPIPEIRPFIWTMLYQIPLMVRTLVAPPLSSNPRGVDAQFIGCLMIELNLESMRNELFPELAKKYFGGPDGFIYQVAVIDGRDFKSIFYESDPHAMAGAFTQPDARISLFENPRERFGPMARRPERSLESPRQQNTGAPGLQFPPEPPLPGPRRAMGPVLSEGEDPGWILVAKHRKGSLEAAVMGMRRRNLAISFGSLLLLSASTALIFVSARRAQRLARLQMDFVAGVSHELRTPLAVICSAGDNLADGVIADSNHSTRRYGELIRDEGRKLADMIEQILQFAGIPRGRGHYSLRPEHINKIVEAALDQAEPMIEAAGFLVEKHLSPNLPQVNADAAALSRAIQNLIQNALKYSGESRWLLIRTLKLRMKRGTEVQLLVEDRGMGIASEDLPHIFEPFFRGSSASAAQIHGTGLGLFMVRETINSMGGSVSAKSTSGKGSTFTIHLPALPESCNHSVEVTRVGSS